MIIVYKADCEVCDESVEIQSETAENAPHICPFCGSALDYEETEI